MEEKKYIVEAEYAGTRADKYIAIMLGEDYSRTYVKKLIDDKHITINGEVIKPSVAVLEGDEIHIKLVPEPKDMDLLPEDIPLDIIYEDNQIIVINKPAGMVVHPAAGNWAGTLVNALMYHCGKLADTGDPVRPGIVHRLDKETSGVLVVAKTDKALRSLARQFQKRAVKKVYKAIVKGRVEFDNGVIDAPIARHKQQRQMMDVEEEGGKNARSEYHVIKRYKKFTFLDVEPKTGRTHQIRVHMKHIGNPVLGDSKYGRKDEFPRHALHAEMIGFTHPETGNYVEFHAPLPVDMQRILEGESHELENK